VVGIELVTYHVATVGYLLHLCGESLVINVQTDGRIICLLIRRRKLMDKKEHEFKDGIRGPIDTVADLPDSGDRREFDTGSVRDVRIGKGRYDLLSPFVTERDAKHMEAGAIKYNDRNWEKGQPLMSYFDSAKRHMESYVACLLLGEKAEEDHLAAVRWNIASFIHTEEMINRGLLPSDLDDRPGPMEKIKGRPYNDKRNVSRGLNGLVCTDPNCSCHDL
jgi:hypothetical protein